MAQQIRDDIKANFRTGDRPEEVHFIDVFDSFVNIIEDDVSVDGNLNLQIGGSITLTNNGNARNEPGTLRWNGTEFQVFDPVSNGFVPLASGDSLWTDLGGNDIIYDQGNVGVGPLTTTNDRFEVELDNDNRRVRTGNTATGNGPGIPLRNYAVFSHTDRREEDSYALVQGPNGDVRLNAASGESLTLRVGGSTACAIENRNTGGYLFVNTPAQLSGNSAFHLQVNGSAFKNDAEGEWNVTSDIRTKKNVQNFEDGLEKLRKLQPVRFEYNGKGGTIKNLKAIGVSAQEMMKIFPYMVQGAQITEDDKDNYLSTNTSSLKFVMLNAINELADRVDQIEKNLAKLMKDNVPDKPLRKRKTD